MAKKLLFTVSALLVLMTLFYGCAPQGITEKQLLTAIAPATATPTRQFPTRPTFTLAPPTETPTALPPTPISGEPVSVTCWSLPEYTSEWSYTVTFETESESFLASCVDKVWNVNFTAEWTKTAKFVNNSGDEIYVIVVIALDKSVHVLFEGIQDLMCDGKDINLRHAYGFNIEPMMSPTICSSGPIQITVEWEVP